MTAFNSRWASNVLGFVWPSSALEFVWAFLKLCLPLVIHYTSFCSIRSHELDFSIKDIVVIDLDRYRIPSILLEVGEALSSFYRYIPEFITEEEESYLLRKIAETPQPKWKNVTKRRLQVWGGEIGPGNTLLAQPLPPFLNSYPNLIERLASTGAFVDSPHKQPNHVIINEYKPGEGIMPHEDGPSYHPVVATISLGSHTVFHYLRYKPDSEHPSLPESAGMDQPSSSTGVTESETREQIPEDKMISKGGRAIDPKPVLSLLLEPRSVIITTGRLYEEYLHWIEEVERDEICALSEDNKGEEEEDWRRQVKIANWEDIRGEKERAVLEKGGVLERGTRVSLTCRDVQKVKKTLLIGRR